MTTSHAGHAHPATKAARAACRRNSLSFKTTPVTRGGHRRIMTTPPAVKLTLLRSLSKHAFKVNDGPTAYATKATGPMGDWFASTTIKFS